jgi:hypothetical protein
LFFEREKYERFEWATLSSDDVDNGYWKASGITEIMSIGNQYHPETLLKGF